MGASIIYACCALTPSLNLLLFQPVVGDKDGKWIHGMSRVIILTENEINSHPTNNAENSFSSLEMFAWFILGT